MKINLVLGHQLPFPPTEGGGASRLVWSLAKQFAGLGHEVTAYSPTRPGLALDERDAFGVRHRRVPGATFHGDQVVNNLRAIPYSRRLRHALLPADVTSFHTPFSFVLRHVGSLGVCTHTIHRSPKWFSAVYGNLDRIYVGSRQVAKEAALIAPNLEEKLLAVPNCVELAGADLRSARSDGEIHFLYVGRVTQDKGLDVLIRAFLEAAGSRPEMRLNIVGPQGSGEGGDTSFFEAMLALVAGHPLGGKVQFERPIYDPDLLRERIAKADLFCLPSREGETLNMAALEAAACGLPLLVSRAGGNPELVPDGTSGAVVAPGDIRAWKEALLALAERGRDKLKEAGRSFRSHVEASFSAKRIAQVYLTDFEMLVERKVRVAYFTGLATNLPKGNRRDAERDGRDARTPRASPRSLRITIVQGAFLPVPPLRGGAVEKMWFRLGQEFAAMGHEVTHLSGLHDGLPESEQIGGVQHVRVRGERMPSNSLLLKWRDLAYTRRIIRRLPAADILVSNTFWLPILARSARDGAVYVDVQRMPKGQMRLYRRAARLRANTTAVAEMILGEAPWAFERVRVIPNALPFDPPTPGSGKTGVLYAGRIHPEKGVRLLIDAIRLLVESRTWPAEWTAKVVGPYLEAEGGGGERYRQQLMRESAALPIEWIEPIFDTGELSKLYARAAIFAYPSLAEQGETFGSAVLEAMAWGAVPVVSNLGCFLDFVGHGSSGYVFDHRTADPAQALSAAIERLIADPSMSERLAAAAIKVAADHASGVVSRQFIDDFNSLIAPSR